MSNNSGSPIVSSYRYTPVWQVADALRQGDTCSVDLLATCRTAFEFDNPHINAIVVQDFEKAVATAQERDREARAGYFRGPLHGIPYTIKESFDVAGWPTTCGHPAYRDVLATAHSDVVRHLNAAGAVLIGKTNVPIYLRDWQTYNELYGTTRNPRDSSLTPGGSSGGSAAAVCAGMSFFDVGSDIGSSIRNPAHFCGIYSHKSSHGIVSLKGHGVGGGLAYPDINVAGPLARSARDLELVLDVIARPAGDMADAYRLDLPANTVQDLKSVRFGLLLTHPIADVDKPVQRCLAMLGHRLEREGCTVIWDAKPSLDAGELMRTYILMLRASTSAYLSDVAFDAALQVAGRAKKDDLSYEALQYVGTVLRHRDWLALQKAREGFADAWRELFTRIDVLLCPAAATAAFPLDEEGEPWQRILTVNGQAQPMTTQLFWAGHSGLCGLPSTVVPAGVTEDGLPVGVQIVAPMYHDRRALRVAALIEEAGYRFVPPAPIRR